MEFVTNYSSFRINLERDKYLSNAFNLSLPIYQNGASGSEIENKDKKDIENYFDFNQINFCSLLSKRDL